MDTRKAAQHLVGQRRKVVGKCQDCQRPIWGYPGKLRCQACKRQAAYARRKAKR